MHPSAKTRTTGLLPNLPLLLSVALLGFLSIDRVRDNAHLFWSFLGTGAGLIGWFVLLRATGRVRGVEPIPPVRQHYIQGLVQLVLFAYWGYLWVQGGDRPMYAQAPLVVAQICYLYAFDGLWAWTRGRVWRLASGPMPIVLSTNLFIWFRDDWFIWQFAMITAGLLGKEFLRWQKDGRSAHIFNPSGFGLMCAATVLIVTDTTELTWAKPLSTTIDVPGIYLLLFALGLVVQHFFAVTLMTFAAAVAMVVSNFVYTEVTGVYLFGSTNLPAAAFLGLMLLMTDPSTSPRTNVGRTIFGAAYGFGYIIAFEVLNRIGAPDLYSKLYPVPVLNLTVKALDAFARTGFVGRLNRRWETALSPRASNAIHMGLWAVVFTALFSNGYFGREHPGRSIEFWKRAVRDRRYSAERGLVKVVGSRAVDPLVPPAERASALNELGVLRMQTGIDASDLTTRINNAAGWFASAAELGSDVAAKNVVQLFLFYRARRSDRDLGRALQRVQQMALTGDAHAAFLTGLAVETGVGVEPDPRGALAMYRRCGKDMLAAQKGIARIGLMRGARFDIEPQASVLRRAALADDGESCYYLAHMARLGRGLPADDRAAQQWLQRAAELGFEPAKAEAKQDGMPPFRPPRRKFLRPPAWATSFPIG